MANTSDGAGKGPPKPGSESTPKKPTPLIDLKATNVGIRDVAGEASAGGTTQQPTPERIASTAAAKAVADAAAGKSGTTSSQPLNPATAKPAAVKPGTATDGAKTSAQATSSGAPAKPGAGAGSSKPAGPPPPARSGGGGLGALFSHLLAGVAGGALALSGWNAVGPGFKPAVQNAELPAAFDRRLKALETAGSRPDVTAETTARLAAVEKQLGQLQTLTRSAAALGEQQKKLAADLAALTARPTAAGTDAATAERIAKLEETLRSLSAAAKEDPQRAGRIPQLAALTGRLSDLESNLANQLAALRKSVTQEVDSRLAQSSESSEAARAGTQRIDRELASVKTEQARIAQRLDELKSADDRVGIALQSVRQSATGLKGDIDSLKGGLPSGMAKAMEPLAKRISGLEQNVSGMVAAERDRRANAERIVLMLELGNLKRTVERGAPYAAELAELSKIDGGKLDLSALERYKTSGVPSAAELARGFGTIANAIIAADSQIQDASWTDRLLAGAKSIVRVRRVDAPADDNSAEAVVARMEKSLKAERLADVLSEAAKLSPKAAQPARGWLEKIEARAAVDRAMARIEDDLKRSLGAGTSDGKKG